MENLFQVLLEESLQEKSSKGAHRLGAVDLGSHLDFEAIYGLVKAALAQLDEGVKPEGAEGWDAVIWVRGSKKMGRAIVVDLNPYKTWRW